MNFVDETHQPSARPDVPMYAPIARALMITGLSRSGLYRALARGDIIARKAGRTTLVDMASVRAYFSRLPAVKLNRAVSASHSGDA